MQTPGHHLSAMRTAAPLVHNITNFVAMNVQANVLLAVGASPAMVHAREEVAEFAGLAQALTVNIGTADAAWAAGMEEAAGVMDRAGGPGSLTRSVWARPASGRTCRRGSWSCGPRWCAATPPRSSRWPGWAGARGRRCGRCGGEAEEAARLLARRTGGVVAVSGPVDLSPTARARCAWPTAIR